ncbi:hypothetical protein NH340_JMT00141 [Sarcoptes scabiei]|nr:hypothetical protein NH340_JMT00141 [Sarcoptes scabiei]
MKNYFSDQIDHQIEQTMRKRIETKIESNLRINLYQKNESCFKSTKRIETTKNDYDRSLMICDDVQRSSLIERLLLLSLCFVGEFSSTFSSSSSSSSTSTLGFQMISNEIFSSRSTTTSSSSSFKSFSSLTIFFNRLRLKVTNFVRKHFDYDFDCREKNSLKLILGENNVIVSVLLVVLATSDAIS